VGGQLDDEQLGGGSMVPGQLPRMVRTVFVPVVDDVRQGGRRPAGGTALRKSPV